MGMTRVRKGPTAALTSAGATIQYTVPASTKTVLKEVTVNNSAAAPATFSLGIGAVNVAADEQYSAYPIPANTSLTFWHQLPLCAAEIICICASATSVTWTFGLEENTL